MRDGVAQSDESAAGRECSRARVQQGESAAGRPALNHSDPYQDARAGMEVL